jgi:hypothetical protein
MGERLTVRQQPPLPVRGLFVLFVRLPAAKPRPTRAGWPGRYLWTIDAQAIPDEAAGRRCVHPEVSGWSIFRAARSGAPVSRLRRSGSGKLPAVSFGPDGTLVRVDPAELDTLRQPIGAKAN